MKDYPKHIFLSFNKEKIIKIFFSLLNNLLENSEDSVSLTLLKRYFSYLQNHNDKHLALLHKHSKLLANEKELNSHKLSIILSSLERLSPHALRDSYLNIGEQSINISYKDNLLREKKTFPITVILENIRSAFNIGSIFRTCECVGAGKIFLCGYTATPEHPAVKKTAMGTYDLVDWEQKENTISVIQNLQAEGVQVFAMETLKNSKSIFEVKLPVPLAFVFGNERFGINPETLLCCDKTLHIPVFGKKNSLNIANSLSITLYEARRSLFSS